MNVKNFPRRYPQDILETVEAIVDTYWPDKSIPVDIERIIEDAGLEIIPEHWLLKEHDIDATLLSDFNSIIVDAESYEKDSLLNRVRFSLAHEFGHYILHKDFFEQNRMDPNKETLIYNLSDYEYRVLEYQANLFAGFLLIPEKEFHQYAVIEGKSEMEMSRIFRVSTQCIRKRDEIYYKMHNEI